MSPRGPPSPAKSARRQTTNRHCAPLKCARRTHHGAALVQVDLVVLVLWLRPHLVRIVPIDRECLHSWTARPEQPRQLVVSRGDESIVEGRETYAVLMARRADVTASTSPLLLIGVLATAAPRASMLGKTIRCRVRAELDLSCLRHKQRDGQKMKNMEGPD